MYFLFRVLYLSFFDSSLVSTCSMMHAIWKFLMRLLFQRFMDTLSYFFVSLYIRALRQTLCTIYRPIRVVQPDFFMTISSQRSFSIAFSISRLLFLDQYSYSKNEDTKTSSLLLDRISSFHSCLSRSSGRRRTRQGEQKKYLHGWDEAICVQGSSQV